MISIELNGEPRAVTAHTVALLLAELDLAPAHVAIERNFVIVPRSTFADAPLADGDRIEIVHFVGGG